jgi:hypothetical protein
MHPSPILIPSASMWQCSTMLEFPMYPHCFTDMAEFITTLRLSPW